MPILDVRAKPSKVQGRRRGRPSKNLERVIYVRVAEKLYEDLSALCVSTEKKTGFPVTIADMVRKIITNAVNTQKV